MKIYRILGKRGRITIPYAIRQRVGFSRDDILSFSESEDGKAVVVRREKICDGCSAAYSRPDSKAALLDLLNSLTDEEQHTALVHLSVRWAEKQGDTTHA